MGVAVVTNASHDKAWEMVDQSGSLHFKAEDTTKFFAYFVSFHRVLHDLITRCNSSIMDLRRSRWPRRARDFTLRVTFAACRLFTWMLVTRFEGSVILRRRHELWCIVYVLVIRAEVLAEPTVSWTGRSDFAQCGEQDVWRRIEGSSELKLVTLNSFSIVVLPYFPMPLSLVRPADYNVA